MIKACQQKRLPIILGWDDHSKLQSILILEKYLPVKLNKCTTYTKNIDLWLTGIVVYIDYMSLDS